MMVMEEDIDTIISKYKKMIKENDKDPKAHRELGLAYSLKGDYEKAVKELETAVGLDPSGADSHYAFGMALDMMGRQDEAIEQYKEAMRLKPDFIEARLSLANAYVEQGKSTMRCRYSTS